MHLLNETLMLLSSSGDEGMFYLGEHWEWLWTNTGSIQVEYDEVMGMCSGPLAHLSTDRGLHA